MPILTAVQASNATYAPDYVPVAVFTGGTSGIGQAMAEAFARYTKGRAHIIIVGRNRAAGEAIIASFPKPTDMSEGWKHEFVSCDLSLMSDIRLNCAALAERLPTINFLVLAAGYGNLIWTEETSEGLDRSLVLRYYSRYVFISSLLPLLIKGRQNGQHAGVMSILGGVHAVNVNLDDLGVAKARSTAFGFGALKVLSQSVGYNDLMMVVRNCIPLLLRDVTSYISLFRHNSYQYFASKNPSIAFTHISPALTKTPGLKIALDLGWVFTPLTWVLIKILQQFSIAPVLQGF
jgi:NAD(P)-dependent dehydrogenase (short-subunit alcohol dehydrogenase family)